MFLSKDKWTLPEYEKIDNKFKKTEIDVIKICNINFKPAFTFQPLYNNM